MNTSDFENLAPAQADLVVAARGALEQAYAPYSGVRVGAALATAGGEVITGANIENAAYGSTLCAERAAIAAAYAQGVREFTALAIAIDAGQADADLVAAPCGACRQVLHEAAENSATPLKIILGSPSGERFIVTDINELLPLAFSAAHLR